MKKKNIIQLIVSLVVLVALIICYFSLKNYNASNDESETSDSTETVEVTNFSTDDVTAVSIQHSGETTLNLQKLNDEWQNIDDNSIEIDDDSVSTFLTSFSKVMAEEKVTDDEDLSKYGLDDPSGIITITTYNGTYTINIGDYNSMISKYYISLDGDSAIYTVDADVYEASNKTVTDFIQADDETEAASTETDSIETTSTETASTETVSTETASTETAGTETANTDAIE